MGYKLQEMKKIITSLDNNQPQALKIKLLQDLIESATAYKKQLINLSSPAQVQTNINSLDVNLRKISEEKFLCKSVQVKNYYEGDYLERFSEIRTSDLKSCDAFEVHNKFWQAHEVFGGNIFASIPLALIDHQQSTALQGLNWLPVLVDIYEITNEFDSKITRGQIISSVANIFNHHLLVREVYGDLLMLLHYTQ